MKLCSNCKHRASDFFPCANCSQIRRGEKSYWEPKEKRCGDCRFLKTSSDQLPCRRCWDYALWVSRDEDLPPSYIDKVLWSGGYKEPAPPVPSPLFIDTLMKIDYHRYLQLKWRKAVNDKKNEQDGWVSVDKKLPEKEEKAIVRLKYGEEEYRVLTFKSSYWHGSHGAYIPLGHTTHWKPFKGMIE